MNVLTVAGAIAVLDVIVQLCVVLRVLVRGDEQREIRHEQELHFQRIDLDARNAADFRIVRVVEVLIVEEFGAEHDTEGSADEALARAARLQRPGDQQTVDVE